MSAQTKKKLTQEIPNKITPITKAPATRYHELWYPDRTLWEKSIEQELDKLDANIYIQWLAPAQLAILPKQVQPIPMTLSFSYKRSADGSKEPKSWSSIQGNRMKQNVHFDQDCTSPTMVERCVTRMVVAHSVENEWTLEPFDIHSAFLHEN